MLFNYNKLFESIETNLSLFIDYDDMQAFSNILY